MRAPPPSLGLTGARGVNLKAARGYISVISREPSFTS